MTEIRDRYPNLFESSLLKLSSVQSAVPPAISIPTPGTFPASAPASPKATEEAKTFPNVPPEALTTNLPQSPTEESTPELPVPFPEVRTRSGRAVRPPSRFGEWGEIALFGLGDADEPSVSQALRSSEFAEWQSAMEKEIVSLEKYNTWEEVAPPLDGRFVDTKWVLKKKRDEHGKLVKFKARLTAQGFTQIPGLDYDETFSPVVRTDTIRRLLPHAVQNNLLTVQYDIKSVYLNAPLEGEIYIKPPQMVTISTGKVLHLWKSIYGPKQAARCWGETLAGVLKKRGFLP